MIYKLQGIFIHREGLWDERGETFFTGRIIQASFAGEVVENKGRMRDCYGDSTISDFFQGGEVLTLGFNKQYQGRPQIIEYAFPAQVDGICYGTFDKSAVGWGLAACKVFGPREKFPQALEILSPKKIIELLMKTCPNNPHWANQ